MLGIINTGCCRRKPWETRLKKGLQAELQAILLLSGTPFRKEGALFHPLFELTLPKEHWRESNDEIEPGAEEG
jgi:hypothetical protein